MRAPVVPDTRFTRLRDSAWQDAAIDPNQTSRADG
jgi:hypothetical protein